MQSWLKAKGTYSNIQIFRRHSRKYKNIVLCRCNPYMLKLECNKILMGNYSCDI